MARLSDRALVLLSTGALVCVAAFAIAGSPLMVQPIAVPAVIRQPEPPDQLEFFTQRNKVTIAAPFNMTAGELVRLYQLEQTREAVFKQLRATNDATPVRKGTRFEVELMYLLPTVTGVGK